MDARRLYAPLAAEEQTQVERDLIVATAPGVQLCAGGPRDLGDPPLDRGVDVFVGRRERELPRRELLFDARERGRDDLPLLLVEQADALEHVHVRARSGEVVDREPAVVRKAHGEREQLVGRPLAEATRPERLSRCFARFGFAHRAPGP